MARLFNGTSDLLKTATSLTLPATTTLSAAFWLWWDGYANDAKVAFQLCSSVTGALGVLPNDGGGSGKFVVFTDDNFPHFASSAVTRPSPGAWHHYVVTCDRTLSGGNAVHAIYVDGASQSLTHPSTDTVTGNFNTAAPLALMRDVDTSSNFAAGRIAEVAIWTTELSAGNVTSLYNSGRGADARTVSLSTLFGYWPICGTDSPEPALMGGPLTVTGTSTSPHPIPGLCDPGRTIMGAASM